MSIRLALGVPGAGKTLALQDMARDAISNGWCVWTICRADEWRAEDNIRWRGAPPEILDVDTSDPDDEELFSELLEARERGGVLVRFPYPWESNAMASLAAQIGDLVVIDDEIDLTARRKGWDDNPWRAFVHRGRHLPDYEGVPREIHVYGAARRPQNLHTDLTELADEVLLFRLQGSNTLSRVKEEGWVDESQLVALTEMENLQYMIWRSTGERAAGQLVGL